MVAIILVFSEPVWLLEWRWHGKTEGLHYLWGNFYFVVRYMGL